MEKLTENRKEAFATEVSNLCHAHFGVRVSSAPLKHLFQSIEYQINKTHRQERISYLLKEAAELGIQIILKET